jgi:hypothetical protein
MEKVEKRNMRNTVERMKCEMGFVNIIASVIAIVVEEMSVMRDNIVKFFCFCFSPVH